MALAGREREMAACRTALQHDEGAAAAMLVGEPGIGKTTLYREFIAEAATGLGRVLTTTGLRGDIDMPMANLVDLLDPAVRDLLPRLPAPQADALRVVLRLLPVQGELDEFLIARAAVNALRELATAGRVLIAVDDVQWLDPDSARLLSVVATWAADAPIGWLVAVRAGHDDEGLSKTVVHELDHRAARIEVTGLDRSTVYELVQERFPGPWSATLLRRIGELSDGNPYVALELARGTVAAGGHIGTHASVPSSLADSLQARLFRLSRPALAAVQAASVTARPTRALLRSVVGAAAGEGVDEALDAAILHADPRNGVLAFTHPLLQEVAMSTIAVAERRRLHLAWAQAVAAPDEAAGHLAAGTAEPDEEVAAAVEAAAQRLIARGAVARATALSEAALALTPDQSGPDGWRRRLMTIDFLDRCEDRARARAFADEWAVEDPPDTVRGQLTFFRGVLSLDWEVGFDLLAQALDQIQDPAFRAHVGALIAHFLAFDWRFDEAIPHADRAIRDAEQSGAPEVLRWARTARAEIAAQTGDPAAAAMLAAARDLPGWPDMWIPIHTPEMALASWHVIRGEVALVLPLVEAVIDAGKRNGRQYSVAGAQLLRMVAEWYAGRWAEVKTQAEPVRQYFKIADQSALFSAVAEHLPAVGQGTDPHLPDELVGHADRAAAQGDPVGPILLRGLAAHLDLSADNPSRAVARMEPVIDRTRKRAFAAPFMVTIEGDLIEALARVGRTGEAQERLDWLRRKAAQLRNPLATITAGRNTAVLHLAGGEPREAAAAAEPAVSLSRKMGLPLELGRCLLVLGTAQRRSRQRRAAATTLDESIGVFRKLGAQGWEARARAERARLVLAAATMLTPTEQRIADLVTLGHSNAEIAATLLVSVKTVEGTLTRIYRKLGIRTRVDLARRTGINPYGLLNLAVAMLPPRIH